MNTFYSKIAFFAVAACATLFVVGCSSVKRPVSVFIDGERNHVQGIAWDDAAAKMYLSFTTRFIIADSRGVQTGSVDRIHGHLGAMTFDPVGRKVYASLEKKNDEIGANISKGLGVKGYSESTFYVAEIDVDRIDHPDTEMDFVMQLHNIVPANEDYNASVNVGGKKLKHRFGCSGIDGVTVAPGFAGDSTRYLYVAYGIYSDNSRTDNDCQILLRYPLDNLDSEPERFFVQTGNTNYGVQNLAYDPYTNLMFLVVYKGSKPWYVNYEMFAVDMSARPVSGIPAGIPYLKHSVNILSLAVPGWHFKYGSCGLCPLGDGYWYFAENGKYETADGIRLNDCDAHLYKWTGTAEPRGKGARLLYDWNDAAPFERLKK